MANNRLYIVDSQNGEKICLAKSHGLGWDLFDIEKVAEWLRDRDYGASFGEKTRTVLKLEAENDDLDLSPVAP